MTGELCEIRLVGFPLAIHAQAQQHHTDLMREFSLITLAAGLGSVDLTYRVPASAAVECRELGEMLDEADEFCRSGDKLLTLATPPEARQFRDWCLHEFISQLSGAAPVAWPDYTSTATHGRS